jgi:hypothetical protein
VVEPLFGVRPQFPYIPYRASGREAQSGKDLSQMGKVPDRSAGQKVVCGPRRPSFVKAGGCVEPHEFQSGLQEECDRLGA